MSELDDRLNEARETVATMGPPEDLWARVVERSNNADAAVLDVTVAHRRRPSLWFAVVAVAACALAVAAVVMADREAVDTIGPADPPTTTEAADDGSTTLARGDNVEIVGYSDRWLVGRTLNVDAVEQDGEVTGEFRVDNVVVRLECADTDTIDGEIRLGGVVTEDPDGQGVPANDGERVAVGDLLALVIREQGPDLDQVMLYADDNAGSCYELVESMPYNLDGGYFSVIEDRDAIETRGVDYSP